MSKDIKLTDGDWEIDPETGDFMLDEGFETSILLALGCDARADSSEVLASENRRGWPGDLYIDINDLFGSKLWLYSQSKLTNNTINGVTNDTNLALNFLLEDNLAKDVTTDTKVNGLTSMESNITISRFNSSAESLRYPTWEKTK
jgi:phage gp46-like protein